MAVQEDKRLKVLLIGDRSFIFCCSNRNYSRIKFEPESANSLADGLQLAAGKVFDAVLLDLGLPDSQGLQTFTKFQSMHPTIPVIISSGLEDEALAAMAVQLGAQDYLTKGSHLTQNDGGSKLLIRSIYYAIERHQIQLTLIQERVPGNARQ